jgi:hypothetical protein
MTGPEREVEARTAVWLETQILLRVGGRTLDIDRVVPSEWPSAIAPLRSPLTLVTAWNPQGKPIDRMTNRAANRALRRTLDTRGLRWCPALGRARDGSWAEPGFAVASLGEDAAAALGAEMDQLAVYVISASEVIVLSSDQSFRRRRPRFRGGYGRAAGRLPSPIGSS